MFYLLLGLICLGKCFGGSLLAVWAMIELAEADQGNTRPPRGGHRLPVAAAAAV